MDYCIEPKVGKVSFETRSSIMEIYYFLIIFLNPLSVLKTKR